MKRNTLGPLTLALLAAVSAASATPVVIKANLVSGAFGISPRIVRRQLYPDFNLRFVNAGAGLQFASGFGLAAEAILLDIHATSYPTNDAFFATRGAAITLGLTGLYVLSEAPRHRSLAYLTLEGMPSFSDIGGFARARAGVNTTWRFLNPEVELSWWREYRGGSFSSPYLYDPHYDYVSLMVRLGLGGWYKLGR